MDQEERFETLKQEKIDINIYKYLEEKLNKLNIEILDIYKGSTFELMNKGLLEGWCWQTTETIGLFMPDNTIIYRANLHFDKIRKYYHSFIMFEYENKKYVFDPCLCMINTAKLYFDIFEVDIIGFVYSKEIRKYFIESIINKKNIKKYKKLPLLNRFMRDCYGFYFLKRDKKEIVICDSENPFTPMYRNNSGYKNIQIKNNKVKSLTVHYYIDV